MKPPGEFRGHFHAGKLYTERSSYKKVVPELTPSTLSMPTAIYFRSPCEIMTNCRKSSFDDVTNYKMTDFGNLILDFLLHAAIACN